LLWTTVCIVAGLFYLDNSPVVMEPTSETSGGLSVTRDNGPDVLVVLDYDAIRASGDTFRRRDWSAAWIGLFEQELGPVSVTVPQKLSASKLEQARAVVLTASVSDRVPEAMQSRLRQYALDGGVLILERPDGRLREAFSANGEAGRQRGRRITFAHGIDDPYRSQLTSMPLRTDYVGSTSPREEAKTLLAIDGAPVVYALPVGRGTVITVDFDLGEQLVSMQQGRPANDFEVSSASGDGEASRRPPTTGDLVMSSEMSGAKIPYADLLERFLVHGVLARYVPLPGIWPFPGDAAGVVMPLHADATLGDDAGWMLEYEAAHDATSTLLSSVDAGLTPAGAAVVDRRGGEVGLLWKRARTPARITEPLGLGRFTPVARPLSLQDQLERLAETVPADTIATTKIAGRWWSRRWDGPFRALAEAGVRWDTSYEPTRAGFAYGTGLPFRPLSTSGLPLPIRELPVVMPGRSAKSFSLEAPLDISRKGHHQALTYTLRPSLFGDHPNVELFEQWVESFDALRRSGHVVTNVRRFADFRRARRRLELSSRMLEDVDLPERRGSAGSDGRAGSGDESSNTSSSSATDDATEPGIVLRVTVEATRSDFSVVVPSTLRDRAFVEARRPPHRRAGRGSAERLETDRETIVGFPVRRIPVDTGSTLIDVYYR
jgi:hypothetical protein